MKRRAEGANAQRQARSAERPTPARRALTPGAQRPRLLLAALLVAGGLLFLAYRVRQGLAPPLERLNLSDAVALTPPPPLPADDRAALQEKLAHLEPARKAAQARPGDLTAQLQFASEAMDAGDKLSALQGFRSALRLNPQGNPVAYEGLGRAQIDLGLCTAALQTYRTLIAHFPTDVEGYLGQSQALDLLDRRPEAVAALESGLQTLPATDIAGRLRLVNQFETYGDSARALAEAQAVRAHAPDAPEAILAVTHLLIQQEQPEEARPLLETLLAKDPNNAHARYQLAVIVNSPLRLARDREQAESLLLQTIERAPQDPPAYKLLGELYQELGKPRQAAYVYTQLLALVPDSADARLQLSYAYARLGDSRTSQEQQQIAQKLLARDQEEARLLQQRDQHPTDPQARLRLARHYQTAGQFDRALPELQAAYALAPGDAPIRHEIAALYARLGLSPPTLPPGGPS